MLLGRVPTSKIMVNTNPIEAYISAFSENVQGVLKKIRITIRDIAPSATEKISYGIPTFDLNGKHLIHYAAFSKHISVFPTSSGIEAFKDKLSKYKTSKGTVQFPLDQPIPYNLIEELVRFRVSEISRES